jgi:bifunctional non-homologous end joining protein LigD
MLATPVDSRQGLPDDGDTWAYEVKWDGMRMLLDLSDGHARLHSRTGRDVAVAFPELVALAKTGLDAELDGEVVTMAGGRPSFAALADRFHVQDPRRATALAASAPATLIAFDLLRLDGEDLTRRPWTERRAALESIPDPRWQLSPVYDDGAALVAATREQGLEGVIAKRRSSRYQAGVRSPDWLKLVHRRTQVALVGGWRPVTSMQSRIGALLLGVWDTGADGTPSLRYAGRAGSGLSGDFEEALRRLLKPLERAAKPFAGEVPRVDAKGATWVAPEVVVEVHHKGRTEAGRLREPVLRGIRTDVEPGDVRDE